MKKGRIEMPTDSSKRQSNLELLRIISMIMIIALHFLGHGGVLEHALPDSRAYYFYWFLEALSFVSVNVFVLLGAYFLCETSFNSKRIMNIWATVLFYSVGIFILILLFRRPENVLLSLYQAFTPVFSNQYWFATKYIGVLLFSPFMNILIRQLSRKAHLALLVISILLFAVIPFLFPLSEVMKVSNGFGLVWFVTLYFTGAYLRKYSSAGIPRLASLPAYIIACSVLPVSLFVIRKISKYMMDMGGILPIDLKITDTFLYEYNSFFVYLGSIFLFLFFLRVRVPKRMGKVIHFFAPLSFGVYLIHDNYLIRPLLWEKLAIWQYVGNPFILVVIMILTTTGIYVIASLVECLRLFLFRILHISSLIDRVAEIVNQRINIDKKDK